MSDVVIKVDNLSKEYHLGTINHGTLYRDLQSWSARLLGKEDPNTQIASYGGSVQSGTFKALDHVSFEVKQGDVLGVIGRNGAGKSTLLKIISQVTAPSGGSIRIKGRIASLLEVGTGFHPELTGRENIFLNGAILGMTKREISGKFDEIVSFAEIEKFIDTPVKRYSSGMYVRLAFAVAAHLEPEILIVDEVLAVGDAHFQKKCLGKIQEVGTEGRTVLFVSHNMQAVRQLCQRGIYLSSGIVLMDDDVNKTIDQYLLSMPTVSSTKSSDEIIQELPPDPAFHLNRISLTQDGKPVREHILNGNPLDIEIDYNVLEPTSGLRVFFDLCDVDGNILFRSFHDEQSDGIPMTENGRYVSKVSIPANLLAPVPYDLIFHSGIYNVRMCIPDGIRVPVIVEASGTKNKAYVSDTHRGKLAPVLMWNTTLNK
jgi:lipopolysaccharide transport system ATP-binding protein